MHRVLGTVYMRCTASRLDERSPRFPRFRSHRDSSCFISLPAELASAGGTLPDVTGSAREQREKPRMWLRLIVQSTTRFANGSLSMKLTRLQADGKTVQLREAVESSGGTWQEVAAMSEADLAALVRSDGVDVLVELTGHTAHNRLGVMAMRPAPVQVRLLPLQHRAELFAGSSTEGTSSILSEGNTTDGHILPDAKCGLR